MGYWIRHRDVNALVGRASAHYVPRQDGTVRCGWKSEGAIPFTAKECAITMKLPFAKEVVKAE